MNDTPASISASDEKSDSRTKWTAHRKDTVVVPGLQMGVGALLVHRFDTSKEANGWNLTGADLTVDTGHPYGWILYTNNTDGRTVRVGVLWDTTTEMLSVEQLHPTQGVVATECDPDIDAVLLDARCRLGAVQAINTQLGAYVCTKASNRAILEAAGFGMLTVVEDGEPVMGA